MIDYPAAVAAGVMPTIPAQYTSDGDAYTLKGVTRPVPTTPPTLTSLSPNSSTLASLPKQVLINGTKFTRDTRVLFGGATPPTNFVSDTQLAVTVDPGPWSAGQVSVIASRGTGFSNALPFTFS